MTDQKLVEVATRLRAMAADWYADAMMLPDRPEHAGEVGRARRLSEELEEYAGSVEDSGVSYRDRRAIEESKDPARAKFKIRIYSILDDLACEAEDSDGCHNDAVERASDDVMRLFDKMRPTYPAPIAVAPAVPARAKRARSKR